MTSDWIETIRSVVRQWECDHFGHMNVQFYMTRISDSSATLMGAVGLDGPFMAKSRLGFAAVQQDIAYLREVRAGMPIMIRARITELAGKKIRVEHEMVNQATGDVACRVNMLSLLLDLDTRRATTAPDGLAWNPTPKPADAPPHATQRNAVNAWECDRMGHLNVSCYMLRALDADVQMAHAMGGPLAGDAMLRPLAHRFFFRRELHAGAVTATWSGVRGVAGDTVHLHHDLRSEPGGAPSAQIETTLGWTTAASNDPLPLPADLRQAALDEAARWTAPPLDDADYPDAALPAATGRDAVESWECEADGRLSCRFIMERFSRASQQFLLQYGLDWGAMRARGWGAAALEYRIRYGRPISAGDAMVIVSGPLEPGRKVFRFRHRIETLAGEMVATADTTGLLFDLTTRKSFDLPPEVLVRLR